MNNITISSQIADALATRAARLARSLFNQTVDLKCEAAAIRTHADKNFQSCAAMFSEAHAKADRLDAKADRLNHEYLEWKHLADTLETAGACRVITL
jgi:hypothetical protein